MIMRIQNHQASKSCRASGPLATGGANCTTKDTMITKEKQMEGLASACPGLAFTVTSDIRRPGRSPYSFAPSTSHLEDSPFRVANCSSSENPDCDIPAGSSDLGREESRPSKKPESGKIPLLPSSHLLSPISNILSPTPHSYLRHAGFSMIEVSVAMSVMVFGIVAILGLFSLSMGGAKDSATDSVTALKAMDILANAKTQTFTNNSGIIRGVFLDLSQPTNFWAIYYDSSGVMVSNQTNQVNASTALAARGAYAAQIVTHAFGVDNGGGTIEWNPALSNNPIIYSLPISTNIALLQIKVIYPAISTNQQTTNFFQTVIVNRGQ